MGLVSPLSFSRSVVSDSLRLHGLQHAWLPCHSLSLRFCSNSCPLNQWCHPTISCSVVPFSSCLQSVPASRSFPMSWLFASGGQSIGASTSASALVLPMNSQDWFLLGLTGLISLQSKGLSRVFSNTTVQKHQFFGTQSSYGPTHICTWLLEKLALTIQTFAGKVMSLLFNTLSRFLITFLPTREATAMRSPRTCEDSAQPIKKCILKKSSPSFKSILGCCED